MAKSKISDDIEDLFDGEEQIQEEEIALPEQEMMASQKDDISKEDAPLEKEEESEVEKQLNKLTNQVRQFEQETSFWRERVKTLEDKAKEREEMDFSRQAEQSESEIKQKILGAQEKKKSAIIEGDIEAQMAAEDEILDLREQLVEKRQALKSQKKEKIELDSPPVSTNSTSTQIPVNLPEGTKNWLEKNKWFLRNSDPEAAEYARILDSSLQKEGYSPDNVAMYNELDRRLQVLLPRLAKSSSRSSPPKPSVAGSSPDGQRSEKLSSRPSRRLTPDDLSTMRRYGFNPNKAEDRLNWIKRNDPLV